MFLTGQAADQLDVSLKTTAKMGPGRASQARTRGNARWIYATARPPLRAAQLLPEAQRGGRSGYRMILGHTIALDPSPAQAACFRRACGTARYSYNWGLAEWQRMYEAGEKPSMAAVKRRWNAHRKAELPWTYDVTKCASGQAIIDLGTAFANFFRDCKKPRKRRKFHYPKFKKKRLNESFELWVDQFDLDWDRVRIPKVGWVRMRENVRFCGVILSATVSFCGGRWLISVQVETDGERDPACNGTVCGVDLGSRTLATIAGENNEVGRASGPKARKRLLGRIKRQQRRISLQRHRAKKACQKASRRQMVRQLRLSRLHARLANIRKDAAHKLTTDLTRRFETIVIEDLNVSGMAKNHSLAGAVLDCGFHEIRRQLQYKATMRGGRILLADRFYPSTQICSCCGAFSGPRGREEMHIERWICSECGAQHERDANAAINLRKLGLAEAEVTCGDMVPLPASLQARQAPWMNREPDGRTCAH
jgi:putative transposase